MRGVFRCLLFAGTRVLHQILPMPIECLEGPDHRCTYRQVHDPVGMGFCRFLGLGQAIPRKIWERRCAHHRFLSLIGRVQPILSQASWRRPWMPPEI